MKICSALIATSRLSTPCRRRSGWTVLSARPAMRHVEPERIRNGPVHRLDAFDIAVKIMSV